MTLLPGKIQHNHNQCLVSVSQFRQGDTQSKPSRYTENERMMSPHLPSIHVTYFTNYFNLNIHILLDTHRKRLASLRITGVFVFPLSFFVFPSFLFFLFLLFLLLIILIYPLMHPACVYNTEEATQKLREVSNDLLILNRHRTLNAIDLRLIKVPFDDISGSDFEIKE